MSGPPDGGQFAEVEEEAEILEIRRGEVCGWREGLPERLAKDEGQAADGAHAHQRGGLADLGEFWDDADGSGLEDAERESEDGFGRGELAGGGFEGDAAGGPMDGVDAGAEVELAAGGEETIGEEVRQAVVALADVGDAIAVDGVFGGLLDAERDGADLVGVGGVEAFDVADGGLTEIGVSGELGVSEEVVEADVGAGEGAELLDGVEHAVTSVAVGGEMAVFEAELRAFAFAKSEAGFGDEGEELGRAAVDELGTELDDLVADTLREDAAADAVGGFDDADAETAIGEGAGAGETGDAGAEDEDVVGVCGRVRRPAWIAMMG